MKIEEKFYTISEAFLKLLCKKHSIRFQQGFDELDFLLFFDDQIKSLVNLKRMSELKFEAEISNGQE